MTYGPDWQEYFHDLKPRQTALVLIDVFDEHPNKALSERVQLNIKEKLVPLVDLVRRKNILVLYALHGFKLNRALSIQKQDVILNFSSSPPFHDFLQKRNIKNLLYAGYASNMCLLFRAVGIYHMSAYNKYNIIIVRDCTLAYETPKTLKGQWANEVVINMVEAQWGSSTTLDDLRAA